MVQSGRKSRCKVMNAKLQIQERIIKYITKVQIKAAEQNQNSRLKKRLGYKTPKQVYLHHLAIQQKAAFYDLHPPYYLN